jgi:hypothetical protein
VEQAAPNRLVVLNEEKVLRILDLLEQDTQPLDEIAQSFGVSAKTVRRIRDGHSWRRVCVRHGRPSQHIALPIDPHQEPYDLVDSLVAIKSHFALSFKHPLYWGWFESWDGPHALASDGYILWESSDLNKYAQFLSQTGIADPPVLATKSEELPTFELEDLMSQPVGDKFTVGAISGDIVRLGQSTFIRSKYLDAANRLKLDIRECGEANEYVYLTRSKPRDPEPMVFACVATIHKEAQL